LANLRPRIRSLVANDKSPTVLFSRMLSPSHRRDINPDGVLLWELCESANGRAPLPPHVVVTSRAHDRNGNLKRRHYALVCSSATALQLTRGGTRDTAKLRNAGDEGKSIGSSQITSVVQRSSSTGKGKIYPITMRATLISPCCVQLVDARELTTQRAPAFGKRMS
jgi:hypothetical protein